MPAYILNKHPQRNGEHWIHNSDKDCVNLPHPGNAIDLGVHPNGYGAVVHARARWPMARINGCSFCSKECHAAETSWDLEYRPC